LRTRSWSYTRIRFLCFTPGGELISLPRGATPVDFAYAVHSGLGDKTVGAKVNGRIVPLNTQLINGDQGRDHHVQEPDPLAGLGKISS